MARVPRSLKGPRTRASALSGECNPVTAQKLSPWAQLPRAMPEACETLMPDFIYSSALICFLIFA